MVRDEHGRFRPERSLSDPDDGVAAAIHRDKCSRKSTLVRQAVELSFDHAEFKESVRHPSVKRCQWQARSRSQTPSSEQRSRGRKVKGDRAWVQQAKT